MYNPNFYQRIKDINYKVVLPVALAAFGIGYALNKYLPEKSRNEVVPALERTIAEEEIITCDLDAYLEEQRREWREKLNTQELQKRRFQIFTPRE